MYQAKFSRSQNISTSRAFSALPSTTGAFGNTPRGVCTSAQTSTVCARCLTGHRTLPSMTTAPTKNSRGLPTQNPRGLPNTKSPRPAQHKVSRSCQTSWLLTTSTILMRAPTAATANTAPPLITTKPNPFAPPRFSSTASPSQPLTPHYLFSTRRHGGLSNVW